MFITLITFILILGLLVFVHEFGHFWVAKRSGVKVHEFAFGFKPRLVSWKRGDTEYAINLLPFGGYVKLEGEDEDPLKAKKNKESFAGKPPAVRAAVLVAGVLMNLLLGWLLLTLSYGMGVLPLTESFSSHPGVINESQIVLVEVRPGSPAEQAGLQRGDSIKKVNGSSVTTVEQFVGTIKAQSGKQTSVEYVRNGKSSLVTVVPRENPPVGEGALGVAPQSVAFTRAPWYKAPGIALLEIGEQVRATIVGFGDFVKGLVVKQRVSEDVSGIVGVGAMTGVVRRLGVGAIMQFIAIISVNLAVINLFPILPLDGGHLLFVAIEALRKGKPVEEKYRSSVALAGLALILTLFVVVTYKDLLRYSIFDWFRNLI